MKTSVGFIGLGNIGLPMAKRLATSGRGFQVIVCGHRRQEPLLEMQKVGAQVVANPREVAAASEIVISIVRDVPQTEAVLGGENGVWQGIREGSILILSSTLPPDYCQGIEKQGKEKGVAVLDAPVSGMAKGAEAGTLTFFVGGEKEVLAQVLPVLEAMGKNIYHMGPVGTGQVAKLGNNLVFFAAIHATGEAIAMAEKAGLGWRQLLDTFKVSTANCWAVHNWEYLGVIARDPARTMELAYKDMEALLHFARSTGVRLPLAGLISQLPLPPFP